ncbi:MAG: 1,4-alpha-glucan branching protein GlgB [Puniceicoccales bacterium]|jgi:1,4-alpha-glucan branching enzyme|nr:1,4-alpha-glucan branching protein GlgB [Puniceicoccales bacterium]
MIISPEELDEFLCAKHALPHDRLGMHPVTKNSTVIGIVVRAYLQNTEKCTVVDISTNEKFDMSRLSDSGFFEVFIKNRREIFAYQFAIETYEEDVVLKHDPYSFLPTISTFDCHLFGQGKHRRIFDRLGACVRTMNGILGTAFAVWAPNAKRVSVVGDFNNWDGRYYPMRMLGASGIWELFIPGVGSFSKYKYELVNSRDELVLKSDPYGSYFEGPPNNAAIIFDSSNFVWNDQPWMEKRAETKWHNSRMAVYEVHLDSWMRVPEDGDRPLTYVELAKKLTNYVKKMGFTHVEFMPITEYPFLKSWGYQVSGYFAPTHRYGTPFDFKKLIDHLHTNNIGVIIDWVPAHFPRDAFALADFDGTQLYEHEDERRRYHEDWGTLVFNYGRHEVRNFLIGSVLNWFEKFHVDGIRVDAVASMLYLDYSRKSGNWLPNCYGGKENIEALEFLREMNDVVHEMFPGTVTIAEESTSFSGVTRRTKYYGLGFDFKWNMGWMHDTLDYFSQDPIYRKHSHNQLTFAMLYQYSENFISSISHDEVVYGKRSMLYKMPGATISEKARHLMALYAYMWLWPGKKTLFMGCEFGQSNEWQYDKSLDWHLLKYPDHRSIQQLITDLNSIYERYDFLAKYDMDSRGFEWISCDDCDNSVIAFIRKDIADSKMIVVCNFTPVERTHYRIGSPEKCFWKEIFNSDCKAYGGMNRGNLGGKQADNLPFHGRPYSLELYLPPLGVLCLVPRGNTHRSAKASKA